MTPAATSGRREYTLAASTSTNSKFKGLEIISETSGLSPDSVLVSIRPAPSNFFNALPPLVASFGMAILSPSFITLSTVWLPHVGVKTNFLSVANVKFHIRQANSYKVAKYAIDHLNRFYIIPGIDIKFARLGAKLFPASLVAKVTYMIQKKILQ